MCFFISFQGNPRLNLAFLANLFHSRPGLEFLVTDMETARITEELNTAHIRYCASFKSLYTGISFILLSIMISK